MLKLLKYEISSNNLISSKPTSHRSNPSSSSFSLFQSRNLSAFPSRHHDLVSNISPLRVQTRRVCSSVVKCTLNNSAPSRVIIEGIVILKKKTISGFKDFLKSSILHIDDAIVGKKVSFQLVSAVHVDPANNYKGKVGKRSYLAEQVNGSTDLADDEFAYRVRFDWDEEVALPGAVIVRNEHDKEFYLRTITFYNFSGHGKVHFLCNSWVYPTRRYQTDRVFFTNKIYLPHQTPVPIRKYREEELEILRGKGKEKKMLEEWDRVYDYAYYNDLGKPEKGPDYVRPILGGSAEHPYPRRIRTGRPPTKKDPNTESSLSLSKAFHIYIPRDEKFGHIKLSDFLGDTVKSVSHGVVGALDAIFDWTPKKFDDFKEVHELYEGDIMIPTSYDKIGNNATTQFVRSLFRSDGAKFLNYPKPDIIKVDKSAWAGDEEFTRQMLAGIHPLIIRHLEEFPPVSKLDPEVYEIKNSKITKELIEGNLGGLSVEEAIQGNKLFILDHHDNVMPFLRKINEKTHSRVYATRTLLFLKEDGTLEPLVIELSRPDADNEVYTPATEGIEASLWMLAKAYVAVNDSGYHQLISHWLHTHAVIEPFIIATNRQLSMLHPIYKLLHPHFRDTLPVNTIARQIALNAHGLFEQAVFPRQYVGEWTSKMYKDWVFTDQALPRDLIKRGMAVKDSKSPHGYKLLIEDYPYAVDGLEIWSAIETWVKKYCSFYYKSDDMIAKDPELQSWWKEVRDKGHGDKKDEQWWPEMKTFDELTETCTTIIWVASALHAVVNFGQYPYSGYMPSRPTISRRFMPTKGTPEYRDLEDKHKAEGIFLNTVTGQLRTLVCISVIELISRHSEDEVYLGQREPGWTSDAPPLEAFKEFSSKLMKIEDDILKRNEDPKLKNRVGPAQLPFTLLCPSSEVGITGRGIPNSVSI